MSRPPTEEPPRCECGCGERVKTCQHGVWSRWCPGHNRRKIARQLTLVIDEPSHNLQLSMFPDLAPPYEL